MITINHEYRKETILPPGAGWGRLKSGVWLAGREDAPQSVVIHATHGQPGSRSASEALFLKQSRAVSAHYVIGRNNPPLVAQILDEMLVGWHAGDVRDPAFSNENSIGIELHAATTEQILDWQKTALAELLTGIRERWHINPIKMDTHRFICDPPKRKSDPATWSQAEFYHWRLINLGS